MEQLRKFIPFILLLVLIIAGVAAYFLLLKPKQAEKQTPPEEQQNENTNGTEVTEENLSNIDPESVIQSSKENFATSQEKALAWHQNAVFVAFSVKLTSLNVNSGTETYVFDSKNEPTNHFVFTISQESKRFIRAIIPVDDYLGMGLLPIDTKYWKLSYAAALQTAEKNGGVEFRDTHLDWNIELTLKRGEPNDWLWWYVEYRQESGTDSLSIQINASSGKVIPGGE